MRFFTALSVAMAAVAGVVSAQSTGPAATVTGTDAAVPTGGVDTGSMGGNAITAPIATDSITAGESYTIEWTNTGGSTVTLVLMDGPTNQLKPVATIVASTSNTGSYTWTVPDNIPASSTYAIRISYDSNPNNYNYSDRFVFNSDATATPTITTAASTSSAASTSTEESSTESETSTESESTTSAPTTSAESTSSMRTSSTRRSSSTTSEPTETSTGAPTNAASSNLSSPVAIIMAVLAAALFIH